MILIIDMMGTSLASAHVSVTLVLFIINYKAIVMNYHNYIIIKKKNINTKEAIS